MNKFNVSSGNILPDDEPGNVPKKARSEQPKIRHQAPVGPTRFIIEKPHPIYWDSFWSRTFSVRLHNDSEFIGTLNEAPGDDHSWVLVNLNWQPAVGNTVTLEQMHQDQRDLQDCIITRITHEDDHWRIAFRELTGHAR